MIIFQSSREELRRWIERAEVRLNILRLCARKPCTLQELAGIKLRETPRLRVTHYGKLAEINVTVGIGECLKRELLVKIGEEANPTAPEGHVDVLRTTLFAFLLSPKLGLLEPEAYSAYLNAWFTQPGPRGFFSAMLDRGNIAELAELLYRLQQELFLVFPRYLQRSFVVIAERAGLDDAQLPEATPAERKRIFGQYYIAGLVTGDELQRQRPRIKNFQVLQLTRPRIGLNQPRLREFLSRNRPELRRLFMRLALGQRLKLKFLLAATRWPAATPPERLPIVPVEREALQAERLAPFFNL